MNLAYNKLLQTEPSRIYLCKPYGEKLCELNSIKSETVSLTLNLLNMSELSFELDKYININNEMVIGNGYDDIDKFMEIEVENYGRFICSSPTVSNDGQLEIKSIECQSLESELQNKFLVGFKVNKGTTDSLEYLADNNVSDTGTAFEYVVLYNDKNPQLSLLDLVLEKCPSWSIGYVDPKIKNKKVSFEVDKQDVYSFLTTEVSKQIECIFDFNTFHRTINVYSKDSIGKDTNVVVGFRSLAKSIDREVANEEDIATRFYVQGGEELDIQYVNFGSNYIENINYYLNEKYFDKETIDKYKQWVAYKESRRKDYIAKSKEFHMANQELTDFKYKLPIDGCDYNQWNNCPMDILEQQYVYFETLLMTMRSGVDAKENGSVDEYDTNNVEYFEISGEDKDEITKMVDAYINAKHKGEPTETYKAYIDNKANEYMVSDLYIIIQYKTNSHRPSKIYKTKHLKNNMPDHDYYMNNLDKTNAGYYTYFEVLNYIMPNILIAIDNFGKGENQDRKDYIDEYEYNWELYGSIELENKLQDLINRLNPLQDYKEPYEPTKVLIPESIYNMNHEEYLKYEERRKSCLAAIEEKNAVVGDMEAGVRDIQAQRTAITKDVQLGKHCKGLNDNGKVIDIEFTDKEYYKITSMYKDTVYTNENIITTSLDDQITIFTRQQELYDDAVDRLIEYSRPQYHFNANIENLFGLVEFNSWHGDFSLGNYIRIMPDDNSSIKLRLISIELNPMDYSSDISITFSDMVNGRDRNDFTALFDNMSGGTGGNISVGNGATNDIQLSTEVLTLIANSGIMNSRLNNISNDILMSNGGVFNTINADYVLTKLAQIDEAEMKKLTSDTAFIKYLNANLVVASEIKTDELVAAMAEITEAQIGTLWVDTAFMKYVETDVVTSNSFSTKTAEIVTATVDTEFVRKIIVENITAEDIFASNTTTGFLTIGNDSSSGNKIQINSSVLQFIDKDNNPYIQLGLDASGKASLIIKNTEGTTIMNQDGVTKDAIANELIVSDMIKKKNASYNGISGDCLDIDSVVTSINDGTTTIKSSQIYFDEESQTLNTKLSSMTTSISNIDDKIKYEVSIESSNGVSIGNETTLTATVYYYGTNTIVENEEEVSKFSYKWYKNGIEITDATNNTYDVILGTDGAAQFSCIVSY